MPLGCGGEHGSGEMKVLWVMETGATVEFSMAVLPKRRLY